ncbi:3-keto-5-aminohexanoate cleavage protein [Antarctobacter sp.]|uniref:3-keto-5-aminohexanoate cleavage protein n=1 Tax=Antarctobacter sp. TaxID=1872577 RepID=UPI002B26CEAB|nr:3-keto-5-aminohexanoate cleavage protein [Antarctobacter sp.]
MVCHPKTSPLSPSIMAAPNGARRVKTDHAGLPMTVGEIAAEALACQRAGASYLHLHVRDATGAHSLDPGHYTEAIAAVRAVAPGLGIQITTEAVGRYSVTEQYDSLRAVHPPAASVSVREMARDTVTAARLYAFAAEAGIALQHILYDASDLETLRAFRARGVIASGDCAVLLVFGSYTPPVLACPTSVPGAVAALRGGFPDWAACAFGQTEEAVLIAVARHGGNVRIGFENNIQRADGATAISTADNIARFRAALAARSADPHAPQPARYTPA